VRKYKENVIERILVAKVPKNKKQKTNIEQKQKQKQKPVNRGDGWAFR
jgi:hypothetical protein